MNEKVTNFQSTLTESSYNLDVSISNITKTLRIFLGQFPGILELFNSFDNTIQLLLQDSTVENSFSKIDLSEDEKTLVGINLVGISKLNTKNCFFSMCNTFDSYIHFELISIITNKNSDIEKIKTEFDKALNKNIISFDSKFVKNNSNINLDIQYKKANDYIVFNPQIYEYPINDLYYNDIDDVFECDNIQYKMPDPKYELSYTMKLMKNKNKSYKIVLQNYNQLSSKVISNLKKILINHYLEIE